MAGFFISDRSFFGLCHPAVRLIGLLLACLPPLLIDRPLPAMTLLGVYTAATLSAAAWKNLWRVKWLIVTFLAVAMVLWPVFHPIPGPPAFHLGPLAPSIGSLLFALAMGVRLIALLVAGVVFLSATRVEDISYGLQKLGMPYRVSFAFSLAFRLTPLFLETAGQIFAAQRVRGLDLQAAGVVARLKGYGAILVPVLITALRRADGLALALESKGFGRSAQRSSIARYSSGWRDVVLIVALLAMLLLSVLCRWGSGWNFLSMLSV